MARDLVDEFYFFVYPRRIPFTKRERTAFRIR